MSKTALKKKTQEFLKFEKNFDLIDRTICDVYFWERIRHPVYQQILNSLADFESMSKDTSGYKQHISGFSGLIKNILIKNPYLTTKSDFLFFGTGRRKMLDNDTWRDIYIDPVLNQMDTNYTCLERPYQLSHLTPAETENLRYTDLIEHTGTMLQKLGLSRISFSEAESQLINTIQRELDERFDLSIPLRQTLKQDLSQRKVRYHLYRRLVNRVNPSIAIIINSYYGRETLVEACQAAQVPVVEFQHGVISRYHMGYSFPDKNKNVFPDYFLTFGDYWGDLVEIPLPDERIISTGYPYLESQYERFDTYDSQNKVVFISQGTIGKQLASLAERLVSHPENKDKVVYKLHPNEQDSWKDKYPELVTSDVRVVENDPSLYRLFSESKRQIGVYSTAIYEGLYFGLDTFILDAPGWEYMNYLTENEYAKSISTVDDYILNQNTNRKKKRIDKQYFFRDDAADNCKQTLVELRKAGSRL